jgi:hypothetical protein
LRAIKIDRFLPAAAADAGGAMTIQPVIPGKSHGCAAPGAQPARYHPAARSS